MSAWLRLHGQSLGEAVRRLSSQPVLTATSILVLALALALPVVAGILLRSLGAATAHFDTDPHVNVYLALDASDDDVKRIERALRSNPEVVAVRFVPRAQALAELKETTHLADLLSSLDRNPLPHAFTVRLRSTDPARLQAARAEWSGLAKIDQVVADFEWSQRLGRWLRFGDRLLAGIGLLLGLAVLFIVGHLIRLQVVTQRDEIEISQLIGATAADVRRPFLYHGSLQGLLAGLVAIGIAAAVATWLDGELQALTPSYASDLKVLFITPWAGSAIVAAAGVLGLIGAWLAVDRELRRFSSHRS